MTTQEKIALLQKLRGSATTGAPPPVPTMPMEIQQNLETPEDPSLMIPPNGPAAGPVNPPMMPPTMSAGDRMPMPEEAEVGRLKAAIAARSQPQPVQRKGFWGSLADVGKAAMPGLAYGNQAPEIMQSYRQEKRQGELDQRNRVAQLQQTMRQRSQDEIAQAEEGRKAEMFPMEQRAAELGIQTAEKKLNEPEKPEKVSLGQGEALAVRGANGKWTIEVQNEPKTPAVRAKKETEITVDGKPMKALMDESGNYFEASPPHRPITGKIGIYEKPTDQGLLDVRSQARIDNVRSQYNQNDTVKTYKIQQDGLQYANSLDPNTKNPADDQGLIYAFAKTMDPNSVVREGEYNTVQRYSQSWADKFGFDAKRIFSNTAFLTPEARANMKAAIKAKVAPVTKQYNQIRDDFKRRVKEVGGSEDDIPDYGAAFDEKSPAEAPVTGAPTKRIRFDTSGRRVN